MLSESHDFLNNHLTRVPITPDDEGTMETRDEMLSTVGAQDMNTSGYEMSDLDDNVLYWENDYFLAHTLFGPGFVTSFPQQRSTA